MVVILDLPFFHPLLYGGPRIRHRFKSATVHHEQLSILTTTPLARSLFNPLLFIAMVAACTPTTASLASTAAAEEALVTRLHAAVGGPPALATYDNPAAVRETVLAALADAQSSAANRDRIARNALTPLERRVVRTVTNRGAAVRSRVRQRRELSRLRAELRDRDQRIAAAEAALTALSASTTPLDLTLPSRPMPALRAPLPPRAPFPPQPAPPPVLPALLVTPADMASPMSPQMADSSLERDLFGSLIDHLIAPIS